MKRMLTARIDMPDITRHPEISQPEPNPAREAPPRTEPEVPRRDQRTGRLAA